MKAKGATVSDSNFEALNNANDSIKIIKKKIKRKFEILIPLFQYLM